VNKRWLCAGLALALLSLDQHAWSDDTCECADMADLMNREAEERAAIKAYRDALAQWGNSPPAATEAARRAFQQGTVQPAVNQASRSGTNKATGGTDAACHTTIDESTACMKEVAAQHEHVHGSACHDQPSAGLNPLGGRHATLADYAREEIAAYEAEAAFVHGTLVNLQANCELRIDFESRIRGTIEATDSQAKARLDASISTPDHQPSVSYRGTGTLDYETKDVGPPKVVGDPMLVKLASPVCYGASEGKGSTALDVVDGELWRSNVPPYEPRLNLTLGVGATDETYTIKGNRKCRQKPIKKAFWSDLFILGKTRTTAANHVLIDDWTFNPRPGVYAEKVIQSTCGATAQLPGPFAAYGPIGACNEATTIVVRLKKK
jgi:hypothetical protein